MKRRTYLKRVIGAGLLFGPLSSLYRCSNADDLTTLDDKKQLLNELAEAIIPATDSPGAREANVGMFIIDMIRYCSDEKEQQTFIRGLNRLEQYVHRRYGHSFSKCSEDQKLSVLEHLEAKALYDMEIINKIYRKLFGEPFIVKLKHLTLEGYCTSHVGATEGLRYDPVPVYYQSCLPMKDGQRSWATK